MGCPCVVHWPLDSNAWIVQAAPDCPYHGVNGELRKKRPVLDSYDWTEIVVIWVFAVSYTVVVAFIAGWL